MGIKVLKTLFVVIAVIIMVSPLASAGSLEPTAPPASTMKTLDEIYNELTNGAIEINAVKAAAGSITPGDTPGFPITITESGSYILTSNLTLPDENTNGIMINANNVTIDLNGFAIIGPNSCTQTAGGTPSLPTGVTCTYDTNQSGIKGHYSKYGITVMNGIVQGMGRFGIDIGLDSKVINVVVAENGWDGVTMRPRCLVDGVTAEKNGISGISGTSQTHIRNCFVRNNTAGIFLIYGESIIEGCIVEFNTQYGILANKNNIIRNNTVKSNSANGIDSGNNCVVTNNVVFNNGNSGLNIGESLYSGNAINGNGGGTVNFSAIQGGTNLCDGNATCP